MKHKKKNKKVLNGTTSVVVITTVEGTFNFLKTPIKT